MAANTIQIVITAVDDASSVFRNVAGGTDSLSGAVTKAGAKLTLATAGIALGLGDAARAAIDYNERITNAAAVLDIDAERQQAISDRILMMSVGTRAGANNIADAYYDIVGGVQDASKHMAILETAVATSEAGNADLAETTQALIAVMNSYNLEAKDAGMVSDVMTQTVADGIGKMGEFATAFPQVTGLANTLGISFADLGSQTAFLTTKGSSASVAVTQLTGMMNSLLRPNTKMKKALAELGYESGEAAVKALGLVGTFEALEQTTVSQEEGFSTLVGRIEAYRGIVHLTGGTFDEFNQSFMDSATGATEAARAIQNASPAAQLDILESSVDALRIGVGEALVPAMLRLVDAVTPYIQIALSWIKANPELTSTILGVVGAVTILGPILLAVGAAIAVITSPIGLVIAAIAALGVAWATNFLGIRDFITNQVGPIVIRFFEWLGGVWENTIKPGLQNLYNWFVTDALPAVVTFVEDTVVPGVQGFIDILASIWTTVQPVLQEIYNWFVTDALPAIADFIDEVVFRVIQPFIDTLQGMWIVISPTLESIRDWFIVSALPAIQDAITWFLDNIWTPLSDSLSNIWADVGPALNDMYTWFDQVFRSIGGIIQPIVDLVIGLFNRARDTVEMLRQIGGGAPATTGGQIIQGGLPANMQTGMPGFAGGIDFVPRPMIANIHRGERVLTANENAEFTAGGKQAINITVEAIYANSVREGQAAADGFMDKLEQRLRSSGIQLNG